MLQQIGGWTSMTSVDFVTGSLIQPPTSPAHPLLCSFHLFCNPTKPLSIPFAPGLSPCSRLCFLPPQITSNTFNSFTHPCLSAQLSSRFESVQLFPFCFCKRAGKSHNWVNWCHHTPIVSKLSGDSTLPDAAMLLFLFHIVAATNSQPSP